MKIFISSTTPSVLFKIEPVASDINVMNKMRTINYGYVLKCYVWTAVHEASHARFLLMSILLAVLPFYCYPQTIRLQCFFC